jgi:colicin import membrane protein
MKTRFLKRSALALLTVGVVAAVLCVGMLAASAQTVQPGTGIQQTTPKGGAASADQIKKRIDTAIKKLEAFKTKKLEKFKKADEKVKKAADEFAAKGLDVTKLKSDVAAVEAKVAGATAEADEVLAALNKARSLESSKNADEFRAAAKDALSKGRSLRKQMGEIRKASKTVRADIRSLRSQVRKSARQSTPQK